MIRKFLSLFMGAPPLKKLSQSQNEAMLETLASAIIVDGEVSAEEMEEVGKAVEELSWHRDDLTAQQYIEDFFPTVEERRESGHEALRELVRDLAARREEEWVLEEAYYMAALITSSDAVIAESERSLLNLMVEEFGLRRERLEFITHKIMKEQSF